ncbi:MAG: hypothetical protein AUK03_08450 [Anaerolineae bacterium CG2_30_64_16]|nr:MAG: hypothetical protein AUK03_08450 [Anaerolineae bacterium CG2_30_64_16]
MQVRRRFLVDDKPVSPGPDEGFQVALGLDDHQMYIRLQAHQRPQRADHVRAEGQIGDKPSVHHIHLDRFNARRFRRADLRAELGQVGG